MVATKAKKGKSARNVKDKAVDADGLVEATPVSECVAAPKKKTKKNDPLAASLVVESVVAETKKKGKKRKLDAVAAADVEETKLAEERTVEESSACPKKCKKSVMRKAAKRLMLELSDIQARLQEVQTCAQFEEALVALKSVQAANPTLKVQQAEQEVLASTKTAPSSKAEIVKKSTCGVSVKATQSCIVEAEDGHDGVVAEHVKVVLCPTSKSCTFETITDKKACKRRKALCVEIEDGDTVPPPVLAFSELQVLPEWVSQALDDNGWSKPTPIQSQALPVLMSGRNLVGVAQTGSGKTGAFLLPAIVHIDAQPKLTAKSKGPVVLILAPTRELAVQISEEADKLLKYSTRSSNHSGGMFSACFYGGGRKQDQLRRFTSSGSHIVVGTPGRLADCVSNKEVPVSRVTYLVLDEADRMLDEGFSGEVGQILADVRPDRQVALFSATWPASVQELAKAVMPATCSAPVRIRVGGAQKSSEDGALQARKGITQEVVVVDYPSEDWKKAEEEKSRLMEAHVRKVLTSVTDSKVLVFVNTKLLADDLSTKLWKDGFQADSMHGGRPQETRLNVLRRFREGELRLLVVTDVFARGLDIPQVSHVVIYEMGETEDYIHRIGRTGRGVDGTGHALVFFEYWPGAPRGAEELIGVLERSEQKVPEKLRAIAAEVQAGKRPTR